MAETLLNPGLTPHIPAFRERFQNATPFKHILMDDFLEQHLAEALLRDFPRFDPKLAMNEFGRIGRKAAVERIDSISPVYSSLSESLKSNSFLALMSELTGIPDLLPDPNMFGGGTHENLNGQELDQHIDFNYDPPTKLHRRLNILVYLYKGWQVEWSGSIELHSNPRDPETNRIQSFNPIFNRAIIFETNEYSWHGFPRINLPAEKRDQSRKSVSIYLYSKDRPEAKKFPEHGTFYVQRPIPSYMKPGYTLTADDVAELKSLLARRDGWIEKYQKAEVTNSGLFGELYQRLHKAGMRL